MNTLLETSLVFLLAAVFTLLQTWRWGWRYRQIHREAQSLASGMERSLSLTHLSTEEKLQYIVELLLQSNRAVAEAQLTLQRERKTIRFFQTLAWNVFAVAAGWLLNSGLERIGWH